MEAVQQSDRFQRPSYTTIVEKCMTECPCGRNAKSEKEEKQTAEVTKMATA
jgi:hypothetical protein